MNNAAKLLFLALLSGLLVFAVIEMRDFGRPDEEDVTEISLYDPSTDTNTTANRTEMDRWILTNSQTNETAANNAVTAVVFDYRGFDTLGEATVLFAAVTGVLVALRRSFPSKPDCKKDVKGGGRR